MADNWSATPITLASPGDWALWEVTIDEATADAFNKGDDPGGGFAIRAATTTEPPDPAQTGLVAFVNDRLAMGFGVGGYELAPEGDTWEDDGRFRIGSPIATGMFGGGYFCPPYDQPNVQGEVAALAVIPTPLVAPWKEGVNTVRIVNWGGVPGSFSETAPSPSVDIDAAFIASGVAIPPSGNTHDAETEPSNFDTHVDGDPAGDVGVALFGSATEPLWVLRATDAIATGSYTHDLTAIEFEKFCIQGPLSVVHVHVHDDTDDAPGEVILTQTGAAGPPDALLALYDLDGEGRAELLGYSTSTSSGPGGLQPETSVSYGGSADGAFPPAWTSVFDHALVGCGGWHVGNVGYG